MEIIFKPKDDFPQIPLTWNYIGEIIKSQTSNNSEELLIYATTWNLHGKIPSNEDLNLFLPTDKEYHLYFIGTQECMRSIAASFINSNKEEWNILLSKKLGKRYQLIDYCDLSSLNIIIFALTSIAKDISNVRKGFIKAGFMNIMANKGAIALSFDYKLKSFLFINSHLEAGHDKCEERNADFQRINQLLTLNYNENNLNNKRIGQGEAKEDKANNDMNENKAQENNKPHKSIEMSNYDLNFPMNASTITDMFDFSIWCGDFNYRINLSNEQIGQYIKTKEFEKLLEYDQFGMEIDSGRLKLNNFDEGIINFMPTYKFDKLTDEYDYNRTPGWTDRILYKAKNICDILQCKYDCIQQLKFSDHKPVFSVFKVEIRNQAFNRSYFNKSLKGTIASQSQSVACNIY